VERRRCSAGFAAKSSTQQKLRSSARRLPQASRGGSFSKRQTRREAGTQSHGSGAEPDSRATEGRVAAAPRESRVSAREAYDCFGSVGERAGRQPSNPGDPLPDGAGNAPVDGGPAERGPRDHGNSVGRRALHRAQVQRTASYATLSRQPQDRRASADSSSRDRRHPCCRSCVLLLEAAGAQADRRVGALACRRARHATDGALATDGGDALRGQHDGRADRGHGALAEVDVAKVEEPAGFISRRALEGTSGFTSL
jgi:hypothetical protein